MSRDHYKGVPKTRDAQVDAQGRLKPLENGNFTRILEGTATKPTGDGSIITTSSIS